MALAYGIAGIVRDQQKVLAVVCTILAGGAILFYLYMVGFQALCR